MLMKKKFFTLTDIPVRQKENDTVKSFKEKLMLFLEQLSQNPDPPSIYDAPPGTGKTAG